MGVEFREREREREEAKASLVRSVRGRVSSRSSRGVDALLLGLSFSDLSGVVRELSSNNLGRSSELFAHRRLAGVGRRRVAGRVRGSERQADEKRIRKRAGDGGRREGRTREGWSSGGATSGRVQLQSRWLFQEQGRRQR